MAVMKKTTVLIGNLKIEVEDIDTLDELVKRYGSTPVNGTSASKATSAKATEGITSDAHLLRALLDGKVTGSQMATFLGTMGRGIKNKLEVWARSEGIWNESYRETFKFDERSGRRLYSLTPESRRRALLKLGENK